MSFVQLFNKEIVDCELNNNQELRISVPNIPSDRLGNNVV